MTPLTAPLTAARSPPIRSPPIGSRPTARRWAHPKAEPLTAS
jgi:hypothetical protein